jgi:hypothetical protein
LGWSDSGAERSCSFWRWTNSKDANGFFQATEVEFLLHMSSDGKLDAEERIIWLTVRDAISWLNEAPGQVRLFLGVREGFSSCSRNEFNT